MCRGGGSDHNAGSTSWCLLAIHDVHQIYIVYRPNPNTYSIYLKQYLHIIYIYIINIFNIYKKMFLKYIHAFVSIYVYINIHIL